MARETTDRNAGIIALTVALIREITGIITRVAALIALITGVRTVITATREELQDRRIDSRAVSRARQEAEDMLHLTSHQVREAITTTGEQISQRTRDPRRMLSMRTLKSRTRIKQADSSSLRRRKSL